MMEHVILLYYYFLSHTHALYKSTNVSALMTPPPPPTHSQCPLITTWLSCCGIKLRMNCFSRESLGHWSRVKVCLRVCVPVCYTSSLLSVQQCFLQKKRFAAGELLVYADDFLHLIFNFTLDCMYICTVTDLQLCCLMYV